MISRILLFRIGATIALEGGSHVGSVEVVKALEEGIGSSRGEDEDMQNMINEIYKNDYDCPYCPYCPHHIPYFHIEEMDRCNNETCSSL